MDFVLKQDDKLLVDFGYSPQQNWLYVNWHDHIDLNSIKIVCKMCLHLLEEYHIPYIINNNLDLKTNFQDLNEWVQNEWMPLAITDGLKYFAHIVPNDFYVRISALDLHRRCNTQIEHRIFTDYESAANWLKACKSEASYKSFLENV